MAGHKPRKLMPNTFNNSNDDQTIPISFTTTLHDQKLPPNNCKAIPFQSNQSCLRNEASSTQKKLSKRFAMPQTDSSQRCTRKHFRKKLAGAFISNDTCLFAATPSLNTDYVTVSHVARWARNGPYSPPTDRPTIRHRFQAPVCPQLCLRR